MALRATGEGGRTWGEALLGRPWLLVAAVALFVALPVLVLGQASENDTRTRLRAAQVDAAIRAADLTKSATRDRWLRIIELVVAISFRPASETSPVGAALYRGD